ncbi:hypothetical protein SASPL_118909 [Salvia splendens]|uniref:Uncharacterized protein n=1 Tax=Salvia splendens TaxID=180675 RepID=A0A8X8Y376_SALSN|nr:hypothetical protein SASPL_118909 [Salvia splendens]
MLQGLAYFALDGGLHHFDFTSYFSDRIDDWLSYDVNRKVENIDLTLKANLPRDCYPFPYKQGKNIDMTLKINLPRDCYPFPYKQGNFPANLKLLKKLSFSYVNVSCEAVAFLLGNCRLLEQLSLCGCPLSSLEVIRTSLMFKCPPYRALDSGEGS